MDTKARLRDMGLGPRSVQTALRTGQEFMDRMERVKPSEGEGTENLPPEIQSVETARTVWRDMCDAKGWSPSYRKRALTALLRVLEITQPMLAKALNPRSKPRRRYVDTSSSHQTRFYIHDCLPLRVRHLSSRSTLYLILFRITEEMIRYMRSACRHTLQKRMLFIHRLLTAAPPLVEDSTDCPVGTVWQRLRTVPAEEWLRRLDGLYPAGEHAAHLKTKTFHVHVLTMKTLHEEVFGPRSDRDTIPLDTGATLLGPNVLNDDIDESDEEGDPNETHRSDRDDPMDVKRTLLSRIKGRVCPAPSNGPDAGQSKRWAFTPKEIQSIMDAAISTRERLVVLLLITTGLRIGGLCRLRSTCRADWGHEIPMDALSTVEKGNRPRTIILLAPVRLLLARYYREDRPPVTPLVFPSATDPHRSIHPTNMWKILRDVFRRAQVTGRHAHPHTFRHTYVHMMRMLGVDTDIIAKMVGHANMETTSRTYSRFNNDELTALTAGVPLFGGSVANDRVALKDQWKEVTARINCPYEFSEREWTRLK